MTLVTFIVSWFLSLVPMAGAPCGAEAPAGPTVQACATTAPPSDTAGGATQKKEADRQPTWGSRSENDRIYNGI